MFDAAGIVSVNPDGRDIAAITGGNDYYQAWSPDGTGLTQLTSDPADDFQPSWSPDGSTIAFVSDRGLGDDETPVRFL